MKTRKIKLQSALFFTAILFLALAVITFAGKPIDTFADGDPAVVRISDEEKDGTIDFPQVKVTYLSDRYLSKSGNQADYYGDIYYSGNMHRTKISINSDESRIMMGFEFSGRDFSDWEILKTTDFDLDYSTNNKILQTLNFEKNYLISATTEGRLRITVTAFNIVTFDGNGGTLISGEEVQKVPEGESATAPTYEREGYTLDGFDVEYDNPTDDITVTAVWSENSTPVSPAPEMDFGEMVKAAVWVPVKFPLPVTVKV